MINTIVQKINAKTLGNNVALIDEAMFESLNNFDQLFALATACAENNLLGDAALIFNCLLKYKDQDARIYYNLGLIFSLIHEHEKSLTFYRKALKLTPNDADLLTNIGATLNTLHRYKEADQILSEALRINPTQVSAWQNKGYALYELHQFKESLNHYDRAISLDPNCRDAWFNRGNALEKLNKFTDARTSFEKVLAIDPGDSLAKWGSMIASIPALFLNEGEIESSRESFLDALRELHLWLSNSEYLANSAEAVGSYQPFYLAYQEKNNKELLSLYGDICHKTMGNWQKTQGLIPTEKKSAEGPLKIGIVTNHILNHSVWNTLVKGWIQNINRSLFEVHIFYVSGFNDDETKVARALATSFTESRRSTIDWVSSILEKKIDILIYPEIGMDSTSCRLANLRLAPLQIASWGHPETTGLPTIDYFVSAKNFEPDDADNNYSEKLVQLPNLGCYYSARNVTSNTVDLKALGLNSEAPLLICPGTPFKYAPQYDWIFTSIAKQLPNCQFVFFGSSEDVLLPVLKGRLEKSFALVNLNFSDYVRIIPWQKTEDFYGLMQSADVFLDTIGFSGFNTAIQAIECGLPIVTRESQFLRGRLASGILKRIGMNELIVSSESEYISLVVKLIQNPEYKAIIKQKIRSNRDVLFDDLAPIRALEEFLIEKARAIGLVCSEP